MPNSIFTIWFKCYACLICIHEHCLQIQHMFILFSSHVNSFEIHYWNLFLLGKCCMVRLVLSQALYNKPKLGTSNFQVQHRYMLFPLNKLLVIFIMLLLSCLNLCLQDIKPEINPVLNPRSAVPDGSLIGVPGKSYDVFSRVCARALLNFYRPINWHVHWILSRKKILWF